MKKKFIFIVCLAFALTSCGDSSKENGTHTEASAEQQWMERIADVVWTEIERPDYNIKFSKPIMEGDIVTGEYVETFPGGSTLCKYEVASEGALKMQIVKNIEGGKEEQVNSAPFDFKIDLLDDGNTLVLNLANGRKLRYSRSKDNNASVKETTTETGTNNSPKNLWLDKIAGDWKNVENGHTVNFGKPSQQGDIITGEMELNESSFIQVFKYNRSADGLMKCKLIRFKMQGDANYTDEDTGKEFDFTFNSDLTDNGNSLTLKHSNGKTYTYKR